MSEVPKKHQLSVDPAKAEGFTMDFDDDGVCPANVRSMVFSILRHSDFLKADIPELKVQYDFTYDDGEEDSGLEVYTVSDRRGLLTQGYGHTFSSANRSELDKWLNLLPEEDAQKVIAYFDAALEARQKIIDSLPPGMGL